MYHFDFIMKCHYIKFYDLVCYINPIYDDIWGCIVTWYPMVSHSDLLELTSKPGYGFIKLVVGDRGRHLKPQRMHSVSLLRLPEAP